MENWWGHFKTITTHTYRVVSFQGGIVPPGTTPRSHQVQSYGVLCGGQYDQGDRSPNEKAHRETGVSRAWRNHKRRNRHHLEYWTDYDPDNGGVRLWEPLIRFEEPLDYCWRNFEGLLDFGRNLYSVW